MNIIPKKTSSTNEELFHFLYPNQNDLLSKMFTRTYYFIEFLLS